MLYLPGQAKIKQIGKNILYCFCEYFYGVSPFDIKLKSHTDWTKSFISSEVLNINFQKC